MTSQELATQATLPERMNYAKALSHSGLLPDAYRNQPANVLLAIEYGQALRIPPIQAINGINVIKGKPTMGADLMAAVIRRAGHKLRIKETPEPLTVTAELIRADDPDYTFTVTWDEAKAREAGLWGSTTWSKYPGQMMRARAISEVARQGASDALMGVTYVPEELGAEPEVVDVTDAVVVEPDLDAEPITDKARAQLFALFNAKGITERERQLAGVTHYTGNVYASRSDLTEHDAQVTITGLQTLPDAPTPDPEPTPEPEPIQAELVEEGDTEWPPTATV